MAAGTIAARPLAATTRLLAWKGKEFAPDGGSLRNLLTPFGVRAVEARVYEDDSWLDSQPCVVLDYSTTSKAAQWVRDEIREVGPDLYLGVVYVRSRRLPVRFSLEFARTEPTSAAAPLDDVDSGAGVTDPGPAGRTTVAATRDEEVRSWPGSRPRQWCPSAGSLIHRITGT